jgi:hypothetical protein
MKISLENNLLCTIEPHVGIVEVQQLHRLSAVVQLKWLSKKIARTQVFVLVLSWGNDANCTYQRIPASAQHGHRRETAKRTGAGG